MNNWYLTKQFGKVKFVSAQTDELMASPNATTAKVVCCSSKTLGRFMENTASFKPLPCLHYTDIHTGFNNY